MGSGFFYPRYPMPDAPPGTLLPQSILFDSPDFRDLLTWEFQDRFVSRLLRSDVQTRFFKGRERVWIFRDPGLRGSPVVGFGTLDICSDYSLPGEPPHLFIPLLATHEDHSGKGYGKRLLRFLIDEAALLARSPGGDGCSDLLFLEAYTFSVAAISLYTKHGAFVEVARGIDPDEDSREYVVMSRNVGIAPSLPG